MNDKIFGVDATWLLRRQFHATNKGIIPGSTGVAAMPATDTDPGVDAIPPLQDPNIIVVSFLQSLLKLIRVYEYQYEFYCLFDRGTYRYRPKEQFTEYKATREYDNSYQACWDAIDIAIPLLRNLGINTIQIGGLEADDLGMYYSHKAKNCILHSADYDWLLSTRPSTDILIARAGAEARLVKYEELMVDHIKEPSDLAYQKAFVGDGSDNIAEIALPCATIEESISKYKSRDLPHELLSRLDRNYNLVRLDRILTDTEIHDVINVQERMTKKPKQFDLIQLLGSVNAPSYMLGVLSKYNRLQNQ